MTDDLQPEKHSLQAGISSLHINCMETTGSSSKVNLLYLKTLALLGAFDISILMLLTELMSAPSYSYSSKHTNLNNCQLC